jgi:hypothetical protein
VPMKPKLPLTLLVSAGSIVTLGVVAYAAAHSVTDQPAPQVVLTTPTRPAAVADARSHVTHEGVAQGSVTTGTTRPSGSDNQGVHDAVGTGSPQPALRDQPASTDDSPSRTDLSSRTPGRGGLTAPTPSVPPSTEVAEAPTTTVAPKPTDDGTSTTSVPGVPVSIDDNGGRGGPDSPGGHRGPG